MQGTAGTVECEAAVWPCIHTANAPSSLSSFSSHDSFITRMGIQFANYDVLVYVRTFAGNSTEFRDKGALMVRDSWSSSVTGYPAQGVVADLTVWERMRKNFLNVEHYFPVGSTIFLITDPYYGSEGTVQDPRLAYTNGRIQGKFVSPCP